MATELMDNPPQDSPDVLQLLAAWKQGDQAAGDALAKLLYVELRGLAGHYLRDRHGHTLQPTALINEAFIRLMEKADAVEWQERSHFIGIAAKYMREILVERARKKSSEKGGGEWLRATFEEAIQVEVAADKNLVALHDALDIFEKNYQRAAKVVELRFFGGLNIKETASVLKIAEETVRRDWNFAKAWLLKELSVGA